MAAARPVGSTATQDTSATSGGDGFNAFSIKKIIPIALVALAVGAVGWKEGMTSPSFIVATVLGVAAFSALSQSLWTMYVGSVADRKKVFESKTFHQLYCQFGLDNAISLFGAGRMRDKLIEEISDSNTTLAHLVVSYRNLESFVEKGILSEEISKLILDFKAKGKTEGDAQLWYASDTAERHNAFFVYNLEPSHLRNLIQLNHDFCVAKANLGFGTAPGAISPFSWEKTETEKPLSVRGKSNGTEWKKKALFSGSMIAGVGAVGAVAAATLFQAPSTHSLVAAVVLVGASRWLAYLNRNVLRQASQTDREAIFNKNSFFALFEDYGVDALLEAGFTVEDLKEKFTKDFLHPGTTFWDMIISNRHKVLRDKKIITEAHYNYLEKIKEEVASLPQKIVIARYGVLTAWDAYAQASVAIQAAVRIDAQYAQDKEGLL